MKNLLIKNLNDNVVIDKVQKMVQHLGKNNFVKLDPNNLIQYRCNANAVKQNIQNEWIKSSFNHSDEPCFEYENLTDNSRFKNAFEEIKTFTNGLPFSIVEIFKSNLDLPHRPEKDVFANIKNYLEVKDGTVLRKQTVCLADKSLQYFHRQQRERKIWYKKFSVFPGRFQISAVNNNVKEKSQSVEIQAEFPWGLETVEIVKIMPFRLSFDSKFFKSLGDAKTLPHVVSSETLLEKALLIFLCDAYDGINEEANSQMLRLHKKLAPYSVAFAGAATTDEIAENLKDLSMLLSKKIRKSGISVLNLPECCRTNVEAQYARNDAFGIPYTIFLNDSTLNDGIIGIRSRDTTLKEQSHVSLIESYMEQLLKNY